MVHLLWIHREHLTALFSLVLSPSPLPGWGWKTLSELALSELSLVELGWIVEGLIIEAEHTTFLQAGVGGVKPGHGGFVPFGQGWKLAEGLVA